jgi:hypothetical protein
MALGTCRARLAGDFLLFVCALGCEYVFRVRGFFPIPILPRVVCGVRR